MYAKLTGIISLRWIIGVVVLWFVYYYGINKIMNSMIVIKEGQRVAVYAYDGKISIHSGPETIFVIFGQYRYLTRHIAGPDEYLIVNYIDGKKEHLTGPITLWFDPRTHVEIQNQSAFQINTNEVLIVYRKNAETNEVTRNIINGPDLYVPSSTEWIHEFVWHGSDQKSSIAHSGIKVPRALKFKKLRTIADQMYVSVPNVRTSDDALVSVKLMLFYELHDIFQMLDSTHDPIGDFINSISADVIAFTCNHTFDEFKEMSVRLNSIEVYQQLISQAEKIGFRIRKIVFRGYTSSDNLQRMTDNAIETRTKLSLEAETAAQEQNLKDFLLGRERKRIEEEQSLRADQINHELKMEMRKKDSEIEIKRKKSRDGIGNGKK